MTRFDDPAFWITALVVLLATRGVTVSRQGRQLILLLATVGLVGLGAGVDELIGVGLVVAYAYLALFWPLGTAGIVVHTLAFSALFVGSQHIHMGPLPLIGLPYLYLRFLHVLIDVRNGQLERPAPLDFVTYMVPFHQLLAGPIERYPAFRAQLDQVAPLSFDDALRAAVRMAEGMVKVLVLVPLIDATFGYGFETGGLAGWLELDAFAVSLYLEFSGYMDVVIGVGVWIGWVPPENFRSPYLSRNLIEFWTRWHITLGEFIRDYLFTPMMLYLQRGPLRGRALTAGLLAYLVAMVWCGMWHRANLQFALWGLLHGLGICAVKLHEAGIKKAFGKKSYKAYRKHRGIQVLATLLTLQFVAVTFLFAFWDTGEALSILLRLFVPG